MTTETSNARGEWVLVPREPSVGMWASAENAMIESECAYNAGEPAARSDAHGFPTMRIWQAVVGYRAMLAAAPPPPAAARVDVPYDRELIARMLDVCGHPMFTLDAYREQARLLREAAQAKPEARGVVDGWKLVVRYGEYDKEPGVWAEKDGSYVWIAALTETRNVR